MLSRIALAATLLVGSVIAATAQNGTPVANFQYWDVHAITTAQGRICFVASRPTDARTDPPGRARSEVLFMVTIGTNETYAQMGYPLAPESEVLVTVDGGESFTMFVEGEGAWLPSRVEDDLLVAAMRGGTEMVVRGRSARGTNTTDTYSLRGITAALERAARECA
ncbi:MAG: invasion associated locus B family protein [Bauldia sp.]